MALGSPPSHRLIGGGNLAGRHFATVFGVCRQYHQGGVRASDADPVIRIGGLAAIGHLAFDAQVHEALGTAVTTREGDVWIMEAEDGPTISFVSARR